MAPGLPAASLFLLRKLELRSPVSSKSLKDSAFSSRENKPNVGLLVGELTGCGRIPPFWALVAHLFQRMVRDRIWSLVLFKTLLSLRCDEYWDV